MKTANLLLLAAFLLSFAMPSYGADRKKQDEKVTYAKIGQEETLNSEGLKIKLFKDASAKPIPSINTMNVRNSKGEKFDAFKVGELWLHDQYVASWGCDQGAISILKMTLPPPTGLKTILNGLCFKEDFDNWKKDLKPDWDENLVAEWLKALTEGKLKDAKGEPVQKDVPKKNKIVRFYSGDAGDDLYRQIYTVECTDRPDERYVLIYELPRGTDMDKSSKVIVQSLQSILFFPPKKAESKEKQLSTNKTGKKKDYSDEYLKSKENVIQNIRNLKDWWYLETDNFIIASNLKNKKTITDLQLNLEKCRSAYVKFYPLKAPLKAVSVCKVFENRDDYLSYVGKELQFSAGVWMSGKKELAVSPMDWGSQSDNRKIMIEIVYHEGFHQYIFYAADEVQSAPWFNEGNATFFEGIDFKAGDKIKIDSTRRLESMKKLAGTNIDIQNFIHLDHGGYLSGNLEQKYALAWGLMFFLQKGAPSLKEKNSYSEIPDKYYDALFELKDGEKATAKAWDGVDFKKFSDDFEEFWKSDTMIRRAEGYDPIAAREKTAAKTPAAPPANPVPAVK